MSSGRFSDVRDVTAKQNSGGQGYSSLFMCAACGGKKGCIGRRLKRVQGIRQWVCSRCASASEK